MRLLKYTFILAIAASFSACSDEYLSGVENEGQDTNAIRLAGEINQASVTRVNDDGFADGDVMGVYIVDYNGNDPGILLSSGNRGDNVRHTFNEADYRWDSAYDLFWKDKHTRIDVYGYYPIGQPENVNAYSFTVQSDQSKTYDDGTMGNYEASDFLFASVKGVEASENPVNMKFRHIMSKLTIRLIKGEDYEGDIPENATVLIHNTVTSATIDLSAGIATKNVKGTKHTITARQTGPTTFTAITVPQRLDNRVPLIEVVMNGVSFMYESKFLFKPGMNHLVNLVVDKNPEQVKIEIGGEITNWN